MRTFSSHSLGQGDFAETKARSDDLYLKQYQHSIDNYSRFKVPGTLFLLPEQFEAIPIQRFVVLVPTESFPASDLSLRIGRYTLPGASIMFVARATDPDHVLSVRRQLALMENMTRSPRVQVQSRLVHDNWIKALKEIWRKGDLIICLEDHKEPQLLVWPVALGKMIYSTLHIPVLIHEDIHIWGKSSLEHTLREIAAWVLFMVTILLFTFIEIQIDHAVVGGLGRVLECMALILEFFLIWKINDFLG